MSDPGLDRIRAVEAKLRAAKRLNAYANEEVAAAYRRLGRAKTNQVEKAKLVHDTRAELSELTDARSQLPGAETWGAAS